jgi:glutamate dehydrogenase
VNEIEEQIVQATLAWKDRLRMRLLEEFGEERGEQLMRELGQGFAPGYRDDFDPRVRSWISSTCSRCRRQRPPRHEPLPPARGRRTITSSCACTTRNAPLPLSDVLPILENLGLRVVTERAYPGARRRWRRYWIQEFSLIYPGRNIDLEQVKEEFEDAFARIWYGEAESDSFNRLLLGSRLSWREIALLRAYACYLGQINFPYSRSLHRRDHGRSPARFPRRSWSCS